MLNFKNIELKLQLEKMVIGLEEPILIKGGGKFIAKVDSGNAGYNVIHGEDLVQQGDILNFKTFDSDNNERRISKKIVDTLNVHIGAGNIQERPVIELDIKFADEDYKKVPFTVTDRSKNSEKVLISKDFVQNQLDALIDVSQVNMTEKEPVEVDYVNERYSEKKPNIFKRMANKLNQGAEFMNYIGKRGTDYNKDRYSSSSSNYSNNSSSNTNKSEEEHIAILKNNIENDAQLIRSKLNSKKNNIDPNIFGDHRPKDVSCVNFDIKRILDYENNLMYGKKLNVKNNNLHDSFIDKWLNRYNLINEAQGSSVPPVEGDTPAQVPQSSVLSSSKPTQVANEKDKKIPEKNIKNNTNDFCIYFCGGLYDGEKLLPNGIENLFKETNGSYENISKTFLENNAFDDSSFKQYCRNLSKKLKATATYNSKGCCGLFAVCTGKIENRNVVLYDSIYDIIESINKK